MIGRLVLAELRHRPGRAALLLGGYALGVAVMVVLLAVGEAMLSQARDEALLGGGDVVIVPRGVSPEMLRSGGSSSLFLGLDQARFIHRQVLESPRGRDSLGIVASSPLIDSRLVRVARPGGNAVQAIARGEIPSRAAAVGGAPELVAGVWRDSHADGRWADPSPDALYDEIDAFHLPYGAAVGDSTWAEWHYFNVVLDPERWIYLTYMVGGRVGVEGQWGGQLLLTIRSRDGAHRSLNRTFPDSAVRFDTASADVALGPASFVRQEDGRYQLRALVAGAEIDLVVTPAPNRIFPPTELGGGEFVSGYVVPALAATAEGRVCLPLGSSPRCETVEGVRAYHDHNWGVWREVSWEWGAASDSAVSLLYGTVKRPDEPDQGIFAYLVDDNGVVGVFRADSLRVAATERSLVDGVPLDLPTALHFEDPRRGLSVEIEVLDRHVTDMQRAAGRYFLQMRGIATVRRVGRDERRLEGFFETYVDSALEEGL